MSKYAALTALAIALNITMLDAETVSASAICGPYTGSLSCTCRFRCGVELWNTAKLWDHASAVQSKPLLQACVRNCMAAKEAPRH
jgi:hypothetical protein